MSKSFLQKLLIITSLCLSSFVLSTQSAQAQSYCDSITEAAVTTLTASECSTPTWTYQFTYPLSSSSQGRCEVQKIQHCGRSQNGRLEYGLKAPVAGEVVVFYNSPISGTSKLTANGQTYTRFTSGTDTWHTGVIVTADQPLNFSVDMGDSPYLGWISPKDGVCRGFANGPGSLNISSLNQAVTKAKATIVARQCWGDGYAYEAGGPNSGRVGLSETQAGNTVNVNCQGSAADCHSVLIEDMDFNDGAYWIAIMPKAAPTLPPRPSVTPTSVPTPNPTRQPLRSSCDALSIVSGNNSLVPAKVTLRGTGSDSYGPIQRYRFFFGDGQNQETTSNEVQHEYTSSGRFSTRLDIKDSSGNWKTGFNCEATVTVEASPIETHKSGCSDLYWTQDNSGQEPSRVQFHITGYDNKGSLQAYKLELGTGATRENSGSTFEELYSTAGTYTVKAYIKDSQGNWKGGDGSCNRTLYVTTKPITQQPKTGTPTAFTLVGVGAGLVGTVAAWWRRRHAR